MTGEGAELGCKLTALVIFLAWIALAPRREPFAIGRPHHARWILQIAPLVGMVLALNFEQALIVRLVPTLLLGAALAATWEEIAFRGVLMGRLWRHGPVTAAWVSSASFGLLHGMQPDWVSAVLSVSMTTGLGLCMAALRIGTGSIWPAVVTHALINLSANATVTATTAARFPQLWIPSLLAVYFLGYGALLLGVVREQAAGEAGG